MSPTITDLLALHDLDLGALAHKVGVTGENFTTAHVKVPSDEAQRIAELEAEVARLSSWEQSLPCCSALSATPRTVAIALLNLAEQQPVSSDSDSLFCWLVQESRAWAALER